MHTNKFVSDWSEGDNSFAEDPPNAVLSFLQDGDAVPEEVTMVIRDPQLTEDTLTYKVEVLDGKLPAKAGPAGRVHRRLLTGTDRPATISKLSSHFWSCV